MTNPGTTGVIPRLVKSAPEKGIAQGTALRNVSVDNDQDLMFMAGERVVLLKRLSDGYCMGYCEGVVGRFIETDVDFAATFSSSSSSPTTAPLSVRAPPPIPADSAPIPPHLSTKSRTRAGSTASTPTKNRSRANSSTLIPAANRSRASSVASISSDNKNRDLDHSTNSSRATQKTPVTLEDATPALSILARHSFLTTVAMDPHATERPGPRKLLSAENLKTSPGHEHMGRKKQVLSSPPASYPEHEQAIVVPPLIPPRSSSRQSKSSGTQKQVSGLVSLATKSSSSSMNSFVDANGSSVSITTSSLEIRPHELVPEQQPSRLSPVSHAQRQQPTPNSTSSNSVNSSRAASPVQPPAKSKARYSRRQSMDDPQLQKQQELEQEQRHVENDHYLSTVLDDLRSKTHHVLQKAGFSMEPTAGLYADRDSKEVDLRVVQMGPSSDYPAISSGVKVTMSTATVVTTASEVEIVKTATTTTTTTTTSSASSATGITFVTPETGSKNRTSGKNSRRGSVKNEGGQNITQTSSISDTSVLDSSTQSRFEKLQSWTRPEPRRRSNSGPVRYSDASLAEKMDSLHDGDPLHPLQSDSKQRPPRQRRISEGTALSMSSTQSSVSIGNSSKYRSKNWFSMPKRNSIQSVEDTRLPHPLGHGIEGGIVSRHLSALIADEDEDDDSDLNEEDEDADGEANGASKSGGEGSAKLYVNDYGFIYDLDDDTNQGQDLSGTGSVVGVDGAVGSNVSTSSEMERKKAIRKQKHNRENELKWIHAVTRLQAENVKKSSKYKKLVRKGVPSSVRGRVWLFLAKADLYRRPGLFDELQKRGPLPIHEVIERDIHRCYPDHIHFRDGMGSTGQQDLHAILKAYAHYKPSVGYCQGMGRLVGMMLMQMPVEDAFWLLVATIEGYMQDYYTPTLRQLRVDAQVFEQLLRGQDPLLAQHLENNDVIPLMYMTQWFMTLFTMSLPWASVLRVWDVFYYDGVKALFRVGLAVLQLCREHLLNKCPTSSELLAYILHIPLEILGPKALLETALQIKLRRNSVQKLIAVTAESMDAAAAKTKPATQSPPATPVSVAPSDSSQSSVNTTAATSTSTTTVVNTGTEGETDTQPSSPSSPTTTAASSPTKQTPPSSAPSSSSSSSFSPLGVFKSRSRSGTIRK
ncbi:hypothetical protein BG011_008046 [Mortierella polycephala]|uniref:Rab-GAP TBC domain-containing protein n=1 Tax=Mortierella polycephala TaxID=41804 RepID=A0A9P6PNS5_9FUNG|nr:hypothetical protein BG011_008046 [Mortierella polycephala]